MYQCLNASVPVLFLITRQLDGMQWNTNFKKWGTTMPKLFFKTALKKKVYTFKNLTIQLILCKSLGWWFYEMRSVALKNRSTLELREWITGQSNLVYSGNLSFVFKIYLVLNFLLILKLHCSLYNGLHKFRASCPCSCSDRCDFITSYKDLLTLGVTHGSWVTCLELVHPI